MKNQTLTIAALSILLLGSGYVIYNQNQVNQANAEAIATLTSADDKRQIEFTEAIEATVDLINFATEAKLNTMVADKFSDVDENRRAIDEYGRETLSSLNSVRTITKAHAERMNQIDEEVTSVIETVRFGFKRQAELSEKLFNQSLGVTEQLADVMSKRLNENTVAINNLK